VKRWSRSFLGAVAALVTLVVSDNILAFTRGPYYLPVTYTTGAIVALILYYSRKKKWGSSFRKLTVETSAWILSVIAIILLQFPQNALGYFDNARLLSGYNLLVALSVFLLILLTLPFFVLSDLSRDLPSLTRAQRGKRVPTIFNPQFVVHDNESLFDKIVYILQNF
jgi:hypothetical protein